MKKFFFLLFAILALCYQVQAQNTVISRAQNEDVKVTWVVPFDSSFTTSTFSIEGSGVSSHSVTANPAGDVTGVTLTVFASTNGTAFASVGTSTTFNTAVNFTGAYSTIRLTFTGLTVSTPSFMAVYTGNSAVAGGGTSGSFLGADTYITYWTSSTGLSGDSGFRYNETPTAPTFSLVESDQAASGKWWATGVSGGTWSLSACDDTGAACVAGISIARTGTAIGLSTFGAAVQSTGYQTGTGAASADVPFSSIASSAAVRTIEFLNTNGGTAAFARLLVGNATGSNASLEMGANGTGFTNSGLQRQDGGYILTGSSLSGQFSIGTIAAAAVVLATTNAARLTISADGTTFLPTDNVTALGGTSNRWTTIDSVLIYTPTINTRSGAFSFGSTAVTPASTGVRFLCISTTGVVASQAAACVGT